MRRLIPMVVVFVLIATACSSDSLPGDGDATGEQGNFAPDSEAADSEGGDTALEEYLNAAPSAISVTVTLDEAGAVEATIGPDGGLVEADGPDGAHYRLDIPAGALADEVAIRMTPIADAISAAIADFTGGVQLEPEGLLMLVPATLTITGVAVPDDVAGYSYSGDGADVTSAPVKVSGDSVDVTVFHFSGDLTGPPAADAPPSRPRKPGERMAEDFIDNQVRTGGCLGLASNLPARVTLENYYVNWYKNDVGPMLEKGATDDMVLGAAIDEFLGWYLLPINWEQSGLLCGDELSSSGAEFHAKAFELLSKGLFNAIDTAAEVCASAHDLGEARNIAGWTAVAGSLTQAYRIELEQGEPPPGSADEGEGALEGPDPEYGLDKLFKCLSFKLVLDTTIRFEQPIGSFWGSIDSEITDMVPTALAQLLGRDEGNKRGNSTADWTPPPDLGEDCTVTQSIMADTTHVPIVDPPIPEPRRKVPMPKSGTATAIAGFGPDRGGPAPGEAKALVLLKPLETNRILEVVCTEGATTQDFSAVGVFFYFLHEDELNQAFGAFEIELDQGSGEVLATKTYDRTKDLEGLPFAELTTIELIHTPGN